MDFISWIPSLTTSALFAIMLWMCRNLISTRLTKSVTYEFDSKLAQLQSQMRDSEERFKVEISSLRSGALSAISSRQISLDKRRFDAAEQIWEAYCSISESRSIVTFISAFKFEETSRESQKNEKFRKLLESMGGEFDIKSLNPKSALKARPFISPMVWAIYSAIHAISAHAVGNWIILKTGAGLPEPLNNTYIIKLLKTALPHYVDFIEKHGILGYNYALEALEERLLDEIRKMLISNKSDAESIKQAAEILKYSKALNEPEPSSSSI